jgi:wobble nucleotide-excising tRNase
MKFDTKFTGFLDNSAKIHQLIKDSFEAAGLTKEFDELSKNQDVGELIKEHLQNTQQNKLSQKNVQAIVKDMYQYFDEEEESQQVA